MILGKLNNKVRYTVQQLKNKIFPGALILMYHRVAEADSDPWSLCVTPKHFAEHLEVLRQYGYPLHLQQLTKRLSDRQYINRSIVVTFDDGYADNFYHAKPLLEKYDIPATVFVTTGGIDQKREFWWDELEQLLLQPDILPDLLRLNIHGKTYQWKLGEATHYSEADHQRDRHCRMGRKLRQYPTLRHTLYRSLYQLLQFLPIYERNKLLDELAIWANAEPVGRSTHRSLSKEEMLALESGGLIEIGAHTVTHPFLSQLPIASQQDEIQHSKDYLEKILGHVITSFSYPHGSYTNETTSIVQETGFTCACSSIVGKVQQNSSFFLLPRVVVEDWDGETFAHWLSRFF
ncbi:polysaccharide deacetylase family protein [Nostoc sp. ATCC 53789]|uniref:polysaccharide deacetylase family protein n=1 Tax=Nostoc sp. ATCC 53789 TaxID=76335 RepID=UPI000DEC9CC6|nr:polysaccharide deacetylase family protein [Nostoc sp. ATCC 53789]QHG19852.1 polysaccharide deacetylase family protein [Nostoc sp. ATCC 53789]RCJ16600.1 polysaccharide deacetylase [Nostoc sp. ATCC 53789]